MDHCITKSTPSIKIIALFVGLVLGMFFMSPAKAVPRETNTTYTPQTIQLAYYHHWRHHGWCYYHPHRCYHRHHWRRWY